MAAQNRGAASDYKIGPEDLLQITLFNIPEAEARVTPRVVTARVSQQGQVNLPLIGDIPVKGRSIAEMEKLLYSRYERYLHDPQVGVVVLEYRQRVSVIGAVHKPGVVELTGPRNVLDLLASAGGLTDKGGSQVHIYRNSPNGRQTFILDLQLASAPAKSEGSSANASILSMPLEGGDVINVPPAGTFFLDGAVHKPGAYSLGRNYALTQAIASAGGLDVEIADYDSVTIYRRRAQAEPATIHVNLNDVLAGNAVDPVIEADDVIVVPMSAGKYFVKRFIGTIFQGVSIGSIAGS